ncbi:bifunctional precorrin-2 dehydrogenase/sirohydrochlorin ferrochelatase [Tumebacillus sp. BK434]|uniref:precorrin-2 dehydrogenase/sirohydrochlorin ferrochelatase family protein n=1 Tax=Tumebacillus sp. BK434 TaxID=2512169 RepID=UPI0010436307|nr:bifunctional precorrin-2 dehydrogenase/sirohydrochlorin ferrochelatase [Tumebacillus sp. BK434]
MLYGAFLQLAGRSCLVVGGGPVAERKITGLLDCQADVTVIAPSLTPPLLKLAEHGTLQWKARPYRAGDAAPFFLIIAATSSRDVNRAVCAEGEQHGRLVNVVNDQSIGNLTVPALLRRGPLTVGISTSGAAPVVAKKLREELEAFFGPEIQQFLHLMADARTRILAEVPDGAERADLLRKLANSELLQLLRAGRTAEAHELLERILGGRG